MNIRPITINSFRGEFEIFSNFFIEPDGTHVEGEFQASKCQRALDRNRFIGLPPAKAKKLGRQVPLRADWESVKDVVMYELVLKKFTDHPDLARKLLATGNGGLVEGNYWHDNYWGICHCSTCPWKGENKLGKILMEVREELRRAQAA
jgi:ribA/ribD-fused uncharacterized protein